MAKFNTQKTTPRVHSPSTTTGQTLTHEGGKAWVRDTRSELVMLAVTNMVGDDTFYEKATDRDARFEALVHQAAVEDAPWFLAFVTWLRGKANMRSASLVAAAEGVRARLAVIKDSDEPREQADGLNRKIVDAVLQRPDEPGEFLAYWITHYGAKLPMPVKRGVADAAQRMYTQRAFLKWDSSSHDYRFGRVLDLTHPGTDPDKPYQGALYKYILDKFHNPDNAVIPTELYTVLANDAVRAAALVSPDVLYDADRLGHAGMTWEDVLPLAGNVGADKRQVWQALIPNMGIMALIRNLRNFDEAGVPDEIAQVVLDQLADPQVIASSRQFPFRFLSAYLNAPSTRWAYALDKALTLSTANVPAFTGRTLVLVDTSGSMTDTVSGKSKVSRMQVGALFGVTLAARAADVDLVGYAGGSFVHPLAKGGSVLRQTEAFMRRSGEVGHGTETSAALRTHFNGHARVVIFTDMQAFRDYGWAYGGGRPGSVSEAVPADVPVFGVNLGGYKPTSLDLSQPNRYEIGGFSDKLFTMVSLLSSGRDAAWPWEV